MAALGDGDLAAAQAAQRTAEAELAGAEAEAGTTEDDAAELQSQPHKLGGRAATSESRVFAAPSVCAQNLQTLQG